MSGNNDFDDMFDENFGDLLGSVKEQPVQPKKSPQQPQMQSAANFNNQVYAGGYASPTPTPNNGQVAPNGNNVAPNAMNGAVVQPKVKDANEQPNVGEAFVSFGTKVSTEPIPRFKATTATKARISLLTDNILSVKMHYVKGLGSFLCFGGKCCEIEGLPKVRYILPIVEYTVNKNGDILSQDIELKGLALGSESYNALADAVIMSGASVKDVDIIVTCSDEQYQKMTFAIDQRNKGASWKKFAGARELVEKYKENRDKLYMTVARKISPETYLTKKGFMNPAAQAPIGITDPEDLLD